VYAIHLTNYMIMQCIWVWQPWRNAMLRI